jgi:hypothetical protein
MPAPKGVHLLSFGGQRFPLTPRNFAPSATGTQFTAGLSMRLLVKGSHARDIQPEPGPLQQLVLRSVVRESPSPPRDVFKKTGEGITEVTYLATVGAEAEPVAFTAWSPLSESHVWALPSYTTSHIEWLVEFLKFLHEIDSERFPGDPEWQKSAEWGTPRIRAEVAELARLEGERARVLAEIEEKIAEHSLELTSAMRDAASGAHALLTDNGDALVTAVVAVLTDLGFKVDDMDKHHDSTTGAKLEDLRVTDPDDPTWICLAEVKGYSKGAKASDVTQITGRPMWSFIRETGHQPSSVWHIVNVWRTENPHRRRPHGLVDADLGQLSDACGALIDTRDLFLIWRDVKEEVLSSIDARRLMRAAMRTFEYHT